MKYAMEGCHEEEIRITPRVALSVGNIHSSRRRPSWLGRARTLQGVAGPTKELHLNTSIKWPGILISHSFKYKRLIPLLRRTSIQLSENRRKTHSLSRVFPQPVIGPAREFLFPILNICTAPSKLSLLSYVEVGFEFLTTHLSF